jgi:hypothetical protein
MLSFWTGILVVSKENQMLPRTLVALTATVALGCLPITTNAFAAGYIAGHGDDDFSGGPAYGYGSPEPGYAGYGSGYGYGSAAYGSPGYGYAGYPGYAYGYGYPDGYGYGYGYGPGGVVGGVIGGLLGAY